MKKKKSLVVLCMIFALMFSFSGMTAFAVLSDVDFTMNVASELQYGAGDPVSVPIIIKTQTDNGFVDLSMYLKFDQDYLSCATILETEVDGFTTYLYERETDGQYGLMINYSSPDGTKTKKDTQIVFTVEFSVKTGVASTENCLLSLEVDEEDVFGLDSNGNKEKGLLTVSDAKDKNLIIVETNADIAQGEVDNGDEPVFYISTPAPNPGTPDKDNKGGCTAGSVIGIIVGALVVFAAGVVVGSIWCQKRLNEDGYDVPAFNLGGFGQARTQPVERERTYEDVAEEYRRSTGRGGSIYDEEIFSQRQTPARTERPSFEDEDDLVDTDYFGRASENRIGAEHASTASLFEEDDDDEFPSELAPRGRGVTTGQDFSSMGFIGGRRERNDDGYGSFENDNDDDGGFSYRSDRRRYR